MNDGIALLSGEKPIHVLIKDISGGFLAYGSTPLPAIGRHPDAVTFSHGIPIFVEAIDTLSAEV